MNEKGLVFAPLVRVSTERQAKRGESLNTQKADLLTDVNAMNGDIYKWYEGQEHATPDYERKILDELMRAVKEKKIDAVILWHIDRWSRDNERSEADLRILKDNGIRFFVRTKEYDLFNPDDYFMIALYVLVGRRQATEQSRKSILNRISRAKQNLPASGRLPYGRTFDKKSSTWGINEDKQNIIYKIANIYLEENYSFEELGKRFNIGNIHKILTNRCADTWDQRFRSKSLRIDELVPTRVPRLLPESLIIDIRNKCNARRMWDHKTQKHEYLLSRMIFDMETGHALTGTTTHRGQRYYKPHDKGTHRYHINADIIEKAVVEELFEALSCKESLKNAIFNGNPISTVAAEFEEQKADHINEEKSLEKKIANYMKAIANFDETSAEMERFTKAISQWERRCEELTDKIKEMDYRLRTLPSDEDIEIKHSEFRNKLFKAHQESHIRSGILLLSLPFHEKKSILQLFFGGKDSNGKRFGVYITPIYGKTRRYKFEAYGKLGSVSGIIQSRDHKYSSISDSELWNGDLPELSRGMAKILLKAKPVALYPKHKEHDLSLDKGQAGKK